MSVFLEQMEAYGADVPAALERFMNREAMYLKFFKMFMAKNSCADLAAQLDRGDYEQARRSAHSLKGVTGNLELTPLYEAVLALEQALRRDEQAPLDGLQKQVQTLYQKLEQIHENVKDS